MNPVSSRNTCISLQSGIPSFMKAELLKHLNACSWIFLKKAFRPQHTLHLFKANVPFLSLFFPFKTEPFSFFFLWKHKLYFIMYSQLSGKSPFLSTWQTVCQLNSPCHVSPPLPTHARRPSLLQLPLAPSATFVIDHWSNPVPTCSSSAYTSNEVLVV